MVEKTCELVERAKTIPDPRRQCQNLKHRLEDILVLGFCGVLAGCDDFVEIAAWANQNNTFFRTFLELPNGIPSHDTFNRVFTLVPTTTLQEVLLPWLLQRRGLPGDWIHLDGKAMRHTRHNRKGLAALHVVSAWAGQTGLTLGQVAVDAKSNEITAMPELLQLLDLQQKIVTIDAMGCQKEIAKIIVEQEGDYVLAAKDNQPTLHAEIQAAFAATAQPFPQHREVTTFAKDHGREESRTVRVLPAAKHLSEATLGAWLGVLSLVMVIRVVTCKASGAVSTEVAYYISSLRPNARRIGGAIRGHWSIENGLHWVLDVVFREDARRLYDRTAAENVAFLNRLALSVLRGDPSKGSLKVKRKRAGWNIQYLAQLLGFPTV
ncbi:MAG TPA: ISAs1 family transposase [Candidatus Acidoferrum sp.]|nr:ISAs1 family transposase [Candidatus Acidoferrum sp.]